MTCDLSEISLDDLLTDNIESTAALDEVIPHPRPDMPAPAVPGQGAPFNTCCSPAVL